MNILHVHLDKQTCEVKPINWDPIKKWIGGRGFNVQYLFNHLPTDTDPLSADNILLLSCGLLTGTSAPTASRLHLNALSPLTGILGSSNIGGHAGARLRSCGIFSVAIHAKAADPVYLYISENKYELRDAKALWGLDAFETQAHLRKTLNGDRLKILTIGPGGENGARFGCIISDKDHAAGRTGLGTVMGAKNVKAIVIAKGNQKSFAASSAEAAKEYALKLKHSDEYKIFSNYGSAGYVKWAHDMGIMGTKNYRSTRFESIDQVDGTRLKKNVVRSSGCFRCPVHCKAELEFKKGTPEAWQATRPEFEPMINLGAKCGLDDLETIVRLDNLCSRLGLDSTSTASTLAFAMDLYEHGIITRKETNGLALTWGNGAAMEALIHQIAMGDGFGKILGQGVRRAATMIGKGAEQYAAHAKGLELTAYHPGAILGTALGYAISSRGGDYNNIYACIEYRWSPEKARQAFDSADAVDINKSGGKGHLVKRSALVNIIIDSLGLCKVPALSLLGAFDLEEEARLTSALTGQAVTPMDLFSAGERIAALERLFNLRHAPDQCTDDLPEMFFKDEKMPLTREHLAQMVQEYYESMGWDTTGRPTQAILNVLGIDMGV